MPKIIPAFGQQTTLFNDDLIITPLKMHGDLEFSRHQHATHMIYDTDGCAYTVLRTLVDKQTQYQRVEVVVTPRFGKMLFIDGVVMSSEVDQRFYHEHMVIPAFYDMPLNNVLVLGAGPRGLISPLLHLNPTHVLAVDIDKEATAIYQEHLIEWTPSHAPNVSYIYDDAHTLLKHQHQHNVNDDSYAKKYDAIICDFTFGADTFTDDFIIMLKRILTPTGRIVAHYGSANFLDDTNQSVREKFNKHFNHVGAWNAFVPSFGDMWGWVLAYDNEIGFEFSKPSLVNLKYLNTVSKIKHLLASEV